MSASTAQVAPAQEAGRPQPQTTVEPPGGPFIRHSQPGRRSQFVSANNAFGGLVAPPLVSAPGYARKFRLRFAATGGTGTAATGTADAPFNCVSLLTLRDAFGTPLIVGPGYEMLYLVPKYSSQHGLFAASDPKNMPTFSAIAASGPGNFTFSTALPLEFAKGYGVISMANASLLPTLNIQLNASSAVYSPLPTGAPTIEVDNDLDFYWLPEGSAIEPPGLGTTCQWIYQNGNPTIGSAGTAVVALPRLGGFLHTLILEIRDATGARIDPWGTRIQVYIDGVPLLDTRFDEIQDDMQIELATGPASVWTRDTGVICISRRTSMSQVNLGLLDTGEAFLSTNPGTLIQIACSPWGTIANPPATMAAIIGQVVPAGALLQGLPEI